MRAGGKPALISCLSGDIAYLGILIFCVRFYTARAGISGGAMMTYFSPNAVGRNRFACLFALMFAVLTAQAQQGAASATSAAAAGAEGTDGVAITADVTYATVDGHELKLDLYLPEGTNNPALLVWVHGGGWRGGSKDNPRVLGFVDQGYALASIDYRLSPMAKFPAQIHDLKAAVRYLRANAGQYGYDATRIAMMGSSAGAHLAALAGVTNGHRELEGTVGDHLEVSSGVQLIVSYYGASNLTTILDQSTPYGLGVRAPALELLLGGLPEDRPELARLASPVFFIDANDPPLFLLHGDQDPQMPINQSHELQGVYEEQDLEVHFVVVHGAVHGGEPFYDATRDALVQAFLDEHFR